MMEYRQRFWEKYASAVQGRSAPLSLEFADRWGASFEAYARGWLPSNPDAEILDVGCGAGLLLRFFSKRGYTNVTGIDISPEQVALARAIHPRVEQADTLEYLARRRGQLDLIAAIDLIEHMTKDEALRFLDGCFQALRPGGSLIIQTINADSPFSNAIRYGDFSHENAFNPSCLASVAGLCGFRDFQAREQTAVPRGVVSMVRWLLWKLVRLGWILESLIETGTPGGGVWTRCFISRCRRP